MRKRGKLVKKPWGCFEQFTLNKLSTVKILTVKKEKRFSLQFHKNREEFWRILSGRAIITIGKKRVKAKKGDEFFIKRNQNHRIESIGEDLEVLEIAYGKFDEKDIVRLEDDYGRIK